MGGILPSSLLPQKTVHGFKGVDLEQFYVGFGTKAWARDLSPVVTEGTSQGRMVVFGWSSVSLLQQGSQ